MDNPKVAIKETHSISKGLMAIKDIKRGEVIADWTGVKYMNLKKQQNCQRM